MSDDSSRERMLTENSAKTNAHHEAHSYERAGSLLLCHHTMTARLSKQERQEIDDALSYIKGYN